MTAPVSVMPKLRRRAQEEALLERVTVFIPRPEWWKHSGCHQQPTEWWYEGGPKSRGARICDTCPVRLDCLTDTIRVEGQMDNIEYVAGHRCLSAFSRRTYLAANRALQDTRTA